MLWALLLLGATFGIAGDYLCKGWVDTQSKFKLAQAVFCYLGATTTWLVLINQGKQLSKIGPAWTIMQAMAAVAIGIWVFKETPSITHKVGIGLAMVSVILLTRK